jgi:hypothetical protein
MGPVSDENGVRYYGRFAARIRICKASGAN